MYAACQHFQAQARAHAAAASGLLGQTEFRLNMPQSLGFASRGRLHGVRLQLALLDREFDDLGSASRNLSPSEEERNSLPVHKYKDTAPQSDGSSQHPISSSSSLGEQEPEVDMNAKAPEDELRCSSCLEQVDGVETIRSLPCLHQFQEVLSLASMNPNLGFRLDRGFLDALIIVPVCDAALESCGHHTRPTLLFKYFCCPKLKKKFTFKLLV